MRSILVLLILVMIGLNGKGQSVTALPDSVLSQCCLEVTLLNGNVTTVDWVFIQYITRDGTGTKLFVEYAPNFGGIQWETQIRIQDDFDDVLERSKFIMLPFTVGSTDYAINRNWIANIEENTTTGGTWVYGRFGTPTKRKFSAVEDYETLKNLLLACRPRAIIVAENGLYTEGDTVRMGGFLIEPTTIQTNTYNFKLIDTLTSLQFGVAYDFVFGDTVIYMNRFWDGGDNSFFFGRNQWQFKTIHPDGTELRHSGSVGPGSVTYNVFASSGTQTALIGANANGASLYAQDLSNDSYSQVSTSAFISELLVGEYSTVRHVGVGAYRETIGGRMWPYIRTANIRDSTATDGQFLQLQNYLTGEAEWATIDLSAYLPIADTAAMLAPYVTFGNLAAYPTGSGTADRSARWSATNTLATGNFTDNGTKVQALLPFQLHQWTTAGRPAGTDGYKGRNTTTGFEEGYFTSQWENYITSTGATNGQISIFSSAGKTYGTNNLFWDNPNIRLGIGTNAPAGGLDIRQGFAQFLYYENTNKPTFLVNRTGSSGQVRFDLAFVGDVKAGIVVNTSGEITYTAQSGGYYPVYHSNGSERMRINTSGNLLLGSTTNIPSAKFVVTSTTQGILPPLWTAAQRTAISSPATGIFGYQTDGTDGVYVKQASAWKRLLWEGDVPTINIYTGDGTFGAGRIGTLTDSLRFRFAGADLFRLKSNGVLHVNMPTESNSFVITSTPSENYNNYRGNVFMVGTTSTGDTTTGTRRNNHEASYFSGNNLVEGGNNVYYNSVAGYGNIIRGDYPKNIVFGTYNTLSGLGEVGIYGYDNVVTGGYTTVIGSRNTVSASESMVLGIGNTLTQNNSFVYGSLVGSTNPTLHGFGTLTPTERVDVNGDARVRDSLRVETTPAHSAITGLLTRNTDGWVGLASLAGGLSYSGGVLTGANWYNSNGTITGYRQANLGTNSYYAVNGAADDDYIDWGLYSSNNMAQTRFTSSISGSGSANTSGTIIEHTLSGGSTKLSDVSSESIRFGATTGTTVYSRLNASMSNSREYARALVQLDSIGNTIMAGLWMKSDSNTTTSVGKQHFAGLLENGFTTGTQRIYVDNSSFTIQTSSHNNSSRFDWFRVEAIDTDTTSNRISFYNRKYYFPNSSPGSGDKVLQWSSGTPSFVSLSSLADGNGIYTGSGTLVSHTTRAAIPETGNLLFTQKYNSNADSAFIQVVNNLDGNREIRLGLTDTASTGRATLVLKQDADNEVMAWELRSSDGSGATRLTGDGGNIAASVDEGFEFQISGMVRAKREAYHEVTSTTSPDTLSNVYSDNLINQGGTQATFTLVMPPSPDDGQICTITYNNAITTLTLDGNGETIIGSAVTTGVPGSQRKFKFYSGIGWIKQY